MTRKSIGMSYLIGVVSQDRLCNSFSMHVFVRALSEEQRAYTALFEDKRTFPSSRLAREREFHPLRFDQQITHETFAEFSERVTRKL